MRSTVFLVMLALCLVALECAASTVEGDLKHSTENPPTTLGTPSSPTAPEDHLHDDQNKHSSSSEKTKKKPESPELQPQTAKLSQAQPQPPELQQPSPTITNQTTGLKKGQEGVVKEHGDDNPTKEDAASFVPPEKPPVVPDPIKPDPALTSVDQPQQVQAPPTNTIQDPLKLQGGTGKALQSGQITPPISTTEEESRGAPAKTQSGTTSGLSGHQDSDALQEPAKDQQVNPELQPPGSTNKLSSSSQSPGIGVQQNPERPSPPTNTDKTLGQGTHLSPNGTKKSPKDHNNAQVPPPISTDNKPDLPDTNKTPVTTPDKKTVPAEKPETFTPAAADKVTSQTSTTTKNKETHSAQTPVTSTAEPAKKESTPPANPSNKLTKAMKSLDITDNSIGSWSHFSLAALSIVVGMAVAPAS